MKIVATTSLPAVDRPNANRLNAARLRQNQTPRDFEKERLQAINQLVLHQLYSKNHTKLPGYLWSMAIFSQKIAIFKIKSQEITHKEPISYN